ncbi:hypothetical protein DESC_780175 [Desulfosarcina cetonica]|nr:hypothetical protein DESC_780175 [Desulfosarcina cetonica]
MVAPSHELKLSEKGLACAGVPGGNISDLYLIYFYIKMHANLSVIIVSAVNGSEKMCFQAG